MSGIALVIFMALCVAGLALWFGSLNQDEGWYLYAAQMVKWGHLPYRDFFYTQGPTMPFVYALFADVWMKPGLLHGLLGGRVVTYIFGLLATFAAMGLVRLLVEDQKRKVAALAVFALLGCNLYHVYFTTIPKTYALGSCFLLAGFWLLAAALVRFEREKFLGWGGVLQLFFAGFMMALATGTRISLLLILPVVGGLLLLKFKSFKWCFLWYGLGGGLGLFLTYGFFALNQAARGGLIAAQQYHAARGGFDLFFALGSVSRLTQGYAALGAILLITLCMWFLKNKKCEVENKKIVRIGNIFTNPISAINLLMLMLGMGFVVVFLLQLSAPFPYDDYQVPIMGMLTVLIVAWFMRVVGNAWVPILLVGMVSFSSPMLQAWATFGQDRFWSCMKPQTEIAQLRSVGREIEKFDPAGKEIVTQDLYLAIETGRKVPAGWEMGPFSFFPNLSTDKAKATHVMNCELIKSTLEKTQAGIIAGSGYMFAIAAPVCDEVSPQIQDELWKLCDKRYNEVATYPKFGQNATPLRILKRSSK